MNVHDAKLVGFNIPTESKIVVNGWWLANNPADRKNPEEFRPKRFLEEEAKVEANGNDFRFPHFDVGAKITGMQQVAVSDEGAGGTPGVGVRRAEGPTETWSNVMAMLR
ncbi:cinnamate 4-hydroxylase [Canna indica]|uniref:Cinnamate 4-hydroxylase n=1 Tax=Canna indica TaxID=4628 RepID=A0AAQ3JNM3_9LILI|nr:cinnamate 4-hydroxylase [Canna indica]